jgi:hypothetical protein
VNDGDYLIIVPRLFRTGTTQSIGVNIFGNKSCDVIFTLHDSEGSGISSQGKGHFQPNEAGMLELQVSLCNVIVRFYFPMIFSFAICLTQMLKIFDLK